MSETPDNLNASAENGVAVRSSAMLAAVVLDHWTFGGTGITNFSKEDRAKYQAAIEAYGDPDIVIHDKPIPGNGASMMPYLERACHSLHCVNGRKDMSDFFRVFKCQQAANDQAQRPGASETHK